MECNILFNKTCSTSYLNVIYCLTKLFVLAKLFVPAMGCNILFNKAFSTSYGMQYIV